MSLTLRRVSRPYPSVWAPPLVVPRFGRKTLADGGRPWSLWVAETPWLRLVAPQWADGLRAVNCHASWAICPTPTLIGFEADFSRAPGKVDLRGAELDITAGFESLRGAIMTTAQFLALAPALARQLGIDLKDG